MAGNSVLQGDDRGVTAPQTPAFAKDTTPDFHDM